MIKESLFDNEAERELFSAINDVELVVQNFVTEGQYGDALTTLANLQAPIDAFFDNVMVMADDISQKQIAWHY